MQPLLELDTQIFLYLNSINHPMINPVMVFISSKLFWLLVYLPIIFLMIKKSKKDTLYIFPIVAVTHIVTDKVSVWIKNVVLRPRPCKVEELVDQINLLVGCSQYGFVSSHAANSFALITILILLKGRWSISNWKWVNHILILWAILTSYSRIYVGVHYPLDIICGAILGIILAHFFYNIFTRVENAALRLRN